MVIHITASTDELGEPISQKVAEAQLASLDRVLALLDIAGINAQLVMRAWVEDKSGESPSLGKRFHPPWLVIYADGGWRVATVSIGPRSGAYAVELARVGPGDQPLADRVEVVPVSEPSRAACLVVRNMVDRCGRVGEAS